MAFDAFLKIDGIPGESADKVHKDEIDLVALSWGETNTGQATAGGGGAGRSVAQDFHFVHHVDKATPLLFFACASGQHIKTAILTCRKAGSTTTTGAAAAAPAKPGEFLVIKMTDVIITSFTEAGASADDRPQDSVSLNFVQMEVDYTPQSPTGVNGTTIARAWNFRANKKI